MAIVRHFRQHRYLLSQLARRNIQTQYRGSWLGTIWSLLTPLVMLGVYTFVFSVVFQSRWGNSTSTGRLDFALNLFASLTAFNLFSQSLASAPSMILANQNYVKRVVFPLEVLPVARFCSNLVEMGLGFVVFVFVALVARGSLPWTIVLLPTALVPLALWSLGGTFFLAALGVFIRDMQSVINLSMTVLMFMSAVFFPLSAVPPGWQKLICFNPMVPILEDVRRVCLQGLMPQWPTWSLTTAGGMLVAMAGLAWFMKLKTSFADVL
jgi:lipopolysaccharide transport system permease protein